MFPIKSHPKPTTNQSGQQHHQPPPTSQNRKGITSTQQVLICLIRLIPNDGIYDMMWTFSPPSIPSLVSSSSLSSFFTTNNHQRHHSTLKQPLLLFMKGLQSFHLHLKNEESLKRYINAPIVLLSSSSPQHQHQNYQQHHDPKTTTTTIRNQNKIVHDTCHYVTFLLQHQMKSLRTVVIQPKFSYAPYPTQEDITTTLELMKRMGATTIAAVGTGNVMDLAKSIATLHHDQINQVLLFPATYNSLLVSLSPHSLLLDPIEQVLTVVHNNNNNHSNHNDNHNMTISPPTTVVTLHDDASTKNKHRLVGSQRDIVFTMISFILSRWYNHYFITQQESHHDDMTVIINRLEQCIALLQRIKKIDTLSSSSTSTSTSKMLTTTTKQQQEHSHHERDDQDQSSSLLHDDIVSLIYDIIYQNQMISYGIDHPNEIRSVSLALSTSLLPNIFAQHHFMEIMISLIPSLCHELLHHIQNQQPQKQKADHPTIMLQKEIVEQIQIETQGLIPLVVTNEPMSTLLSEIHSNRSLWKVNDIPDHKLVHILKGNTLY
jgi:hypothetical protein